MKPYYEDDLVKLHHGNALMVAAMLEPASIRTIVTSPPYFGLRDYGHEDQLGAEASVGEYVANLVALFAALRPALVDDGTLWLNLGDSYASSSASGASGRNGMRNGRRFTASKITAKAGEVSPKNLIGVPWRVAFALQDDGWILRSDIIWAKSNPMPESVTDRPTKSHEYLFLFAKSPRYYYDAGAIREWETTGHSDPGRRRQNGGGSLESLAGGFKGAVMEPTSGRNKRDVWTVATQPFPGAHFAAYPPELIRPCILAGSAPGDAVLDPFSGSGTTGMVATEEGRKYIGIDVNSDYLDLSLRTRFAQPVLNLEDAS